MGIDLVLGLASTAFDLARTQRVYSSSDFNAYGRNPEKVRVRVVETIGDWGYQAKAASRFSKSAESLQPINPRPPYISWTSSLQAANTR